MPINYRKVATLEAIVQQGQPAAYVWRLWDGETRVTRHGIIQKVINRPQAAFTVTVVDAVGQEFELTGTALCNPPPVIKGGRFGLTAPVFPYTISLQVTADSNAGTGLSVQWLDANQSVLSSSNPFSYTVTAETTRLYLKVYETGDSSSYTLVDFVIFGRANTPPSVSQISSGLEPAMWSSVVFPCDAATTGPEPLATLSSVDTVQLLEGSRVLVKNQVNKAENGFYTASAGPWVRTSDPLQIGATVRILKGFENAGRYFSLAADLEPDSIIPGITELTFPRIDVPYDGTVVPGATMVFEASITEKDEQPVFYSAAVIGAGDSGQVAPGEVVVLRMVKDIESQAPGQKDVVVSAQDPVSQTISRLTPILT